MKKSNFDNKDRRNLHNYIAYEMKLGIEIDFINDLQLNEDQKSDFFSEVISDFLYLNKFEKAIEFFNINKGTMNKTDIHDALLRLIDQSSNPEPLINEAKEYLGAMTNINQFEYLELFETLAKKGHAIDSELSELKDVVSSGCNDTQLPAEGEVRVRLLKLKEVRERLLALMIKTGKLNTVRTLIRGTEFNFYDAFYNDEIYYYIENHRYNDTIDLIKNYTNTDLIKKGDKIHYLNKLLQKIVKDKKLAELEKQKCINSVLNLLKRIDYARFEYELNMIFETLIKAGEFKYIMNLDDFISRGIDHVKCMELLGTIIKQIINERDCII